MIRNFARVSIGLAWFILFCVPARGQNQTFSSDPAVFIKELRAEVEKANDKALTDWIKDFEEKWAAGTYNGDEQSSLISECMVMRLKTYGIINEIVPFIRCFETLKGEHFGRVDSRQFFTVMDSCVQMLDRKQTLKFVRSIQTFLTSGDVFKTTNASWSFTNGSPRLGFRTVRDEETGKKISFPYFDFDNTNLIYRCLNDSTYIYNTKGTLNLSNLVFKANGGRIDWAKMKLDPNDVYCEFDEYMLNLNYSFVNIDTVTFHYNSLLDRPLRGKFEEINKGYNDINKANYPYFRSYEGGVVIENLIPNTRYEGGFSLRGVRKIGSAYYEYRDVPPAPEEPVDSAFLNFEEENLQPEYEEDAFFDPDAEEDPFFNEDNIMEEETGDTPVEEESPFFEDINDDFVNKELVYHKAKLVIMRHGEPSIKLQANEFVLDLKKLFAHRVETVIYLSGGDSLSHPSMDLLYLVDSAEVVLMKDWKDKFGRQGMRSSFHNYSLYFDAVRWKQNTDTLHFTALIDKEHERAAVESYDYFNMERYMDAKGILSFHPLGVIHIYAYKYPGKDIYAEDVLKDIGKEKDLYAFDLHLKELEGSGWFDYRPEENMRIIPYQRLHDWAMAARAKKDYDNVQLVSEVEEGSHAKMDFNTKEMILNGTRPFVLADTQFVAVVPYKSTVKVTDKRNLFFGGVVGAGKLNFYGEQIEKFKYDYENHKVILDSVDSLRFILVRHPPLGFEFSPLQKALRSTVIEGLTGAIYINKPDNRSSRERSPEYSVLDSYTNCYVYWARGNIHGGVYTKDKLYFSIDPFVLDSLDTFNERALSFEGEFFSNDIFPKFKQKLAVMDDQTLGFKQVTPDTGYPMYAGKGRFNNEITLDGSGLGGKGDVDFLNTVAKSDSFEFFFDSVKAVTKEFNMPGGTRNGAFFPEVKASEVKYKWLTQQDVIELESTTGEPILLFEGEGRFDGKLVITKEGVKGNGTLTMGNVVVKSGEFVFGEKDFIAHQGSFIVNDRSDPNKMLYKGDSLEIDYDVTKHHSTFIATDPGVATGSFPAQQFKTSLGKGEYDKAGNNLVLDAISVKAGESFFISSDPNQDSLNFMAQHATYNFDEQAIKIDSVPYILVADAKVVPDNQKVTIKPDGFVQKLTNAKINAQFVSGKAGYHDLYEADVLISSRQNYSGTAKYSYDSVGGKPQHINMTEISVRARDTVTIAKGTITEDEGFYLTDRIFFKGETYLTASNKYMVFKGQVKIESDNEFFKDSWIDFDTIVNPDSVFVPIDRSKMKTLVAGLHFAPKFRVFYSTFLQPKKEKTDADVMLSSGGLTFDRTYNEFRIIPQQKLAGRIWRGTVSGFNDQDLVITTWGLLAFPYNFKQNTIAVKMAGEWRDDMANKEIVTDLVMAIKFDAIPKEAYAKLAEKFKVMLALNGDIKYSERELQESLSEIIDEGKKDEKQTQDFVANVKSSIIYTDIKVAKMLPYSLVLSGVQFRYDPDFKALYASGEVGIVGINGEPMNKMASTNCKIEYNLGKITGTGAQLSDTLSIYLEIDQDNWIYFQFYDDVINTWSSDLDGYNSILVAEINKRKKADGYRFELVSDTEKEDFISRFSARYIFRTGR